MDVWLMWEFICPCLSVLVFRSGPTQTCNSEVQPWIPGAFGSNCRRNGCRYRTVFPVDIRSLHQWGGETASAFEDASWSCASWIKKRSHPCMCFSFQGRALQTASSLDEGLSQVVSLMPYASLDLQNNNRLVHLSAPLRTLQVGCLNSTRSNVCPS